MKKLILGLSLLWSGSVLPLPAAVQSGYITRSLTVTAPAYSLLLAVDWNCDDYPQSSAPGRVELLDSGGNLVAQFSGSVYRDTGPSISITGAGSVTEVSFWMFRYAADGSPAAGSLQATWNLTGLTPGDYSVRLWGYGSSQTGRNATTVWTNADVLGSYPTPGVNVAPTIAWLAAPASTGSGQTYTVTARGHDDDGDLVQVNVWKNGQPFAFAGGSNGTDSDSGNSTSDAGPQTVTFTAQAVDATGAVSAVISHVVPIDAPANQPPTVTLLSPGGQTVTAGTTLTISARATDPDGNLSGHNLDIQRPAGDWNFQGGFATGEPFQGGPVGSGADSTRTANFAFSDVGTYYVRSGATDGSGWYHSATVVVTVIAPPPAQYSLMTAATAGGTVSPGASYAAGSTATVVATPDATHDFAGWSGDAGGVANPLGVLMDRNKSVQANFAVKSFALTTSAMSGGSATPGGTYPYGTTVTIAAMSDGAHYFTGWTGDAAGTASSIAVLLDRAKFVQAQFASKAAQTISFSPPGDQNVGAIVPLTASSSSGLPVSFVVLGGPANFSNGTLTVTGPGPVTIQAVQPGDTYTLAAAPVTGTFNAAAPAVLKYQAAARTLLQTGRAAETTNYVIGNP